MEVTISIPDQVWNEDPTYKAYFELVQMMVNRMSVSHYKYGRVDVNATMAEVDELRCALQRVSMYNPRYVSEEVWRGQKAKPLNTGNTENLLDAANFLLIESCYPKHPKAKFLAQTSAESPGLVYKE